MKLLFIFGAPAVGKLTIANEIAAHTDFKVFHNHLTIDSIEPIFDFGTESFWKLVYSFRLEAISEAACVGQNLIHTFCYARDSDDKYVAEVTEAVESSGGEICFVLLTCERAELEKRVLEESRLKFKKANNLEILNEILDKYELFSPVPTRKSLIIDNTNLAPETVARKIIERFHLR